MATLNITVLWEAIGDFHCQLYSRHNESMVERAAFSIACILIAMSLSKECSFDNQRATHLLCSPECVLREYPPKRKPLALNSSGLPLFKTDSTIRL